MTARTCPDWPALMEVDPDLQFKHYAASELQLPADVVVRLPDASPADVEICCDAASHVFYSEHTDPRLAEALAGSHWYELREWATRGPGASAA